MPFVRILYDSHSGSHTGQGAETAMDLGLVGPAQSKYLFHFTGRNSGSRPNWVPEHIRGMSPQERLDAILREEKFRVFAPFGAAMPGESGSLGMPCLCLSESSTEHLAHLVAARGFSPWGLVFSREAIHAKGGGAVAYLPEHAHDDLRRSGLGHWAVRTSEGSTWLHEREWRVPFASGEAMIKSVMAILIADAEWRPAMEPSGQWVDGETELPLPGPVSPEAVEQDDYPRLWRDSSIWVWNQQKRDFSKYAPGELR
ncbi:hypothetical protein GCM10010253_63880 [Streptomyces badius]|uniref:Uncharacterized protein n=2 Tax=Streptomyces badius TaxID=1941 RepID=A0ABQ2TQP7_STRBA|nr:hypothetical protein GCM10010253_63880 [Streptomyces badius]